MTKSHPPEWGKQELAKADQAVARGKLEQAAQPLATAAHYDARKQVVVIELVNGASFAFAPGLAQGLEGACAPDLSEIEITPMGTGLHWPRLDADLTVDGLLAGIFASRNWMRAHAAVVLAVGHHQFVALGEAGIKALGQSGAVLFDVKSILPLGAADGRL